MIQRFQTVVKRCRGQHIHVSRKVDHINKLVKKGGDIADKKTHQNSVDGCRGNLGPHSWTDHCCPCLGFLLSGGQRVCMFDAELHQQGGEHSRPG